MLGRHHVTSGIALGVIGVSAATIVGVGALSNAGTDTASMTGYAHWFDAKLQYWQGLSVVDTVKTLALGGLMFVLGTLLPDIDSPTSSINRMLHLRHVRWPFPHRTLTHSIWPILALLVLSGIWPYFAWLAAGMATHVILDAFSTSGVCLLWPITHYKRSHKRRRYNPHHLAIYKVGGHMENAINRALVLTALALCCIAAVTLARYMTN